MSLRDDECVSFLQWALPRLHMRWPGFRKVRSQVCKRIGRRIRKLMLDNFSDYRKYLEKHEDEWLILDELSRVTISRFYRDRQMFSLLEQEILPSLAEQTIKRGDDHLRIWCMGIGSGEEPYTISILWRLVFQERYPDLCLKIYASEVDDTMLDRARSACYEYTSVKNLPQRWQKEAFFKDEEQFCLKPEFKKNIYYLHHDIRKDLSKTLSAHDFDLVLCRNLVFTYYENTLQAEILGRILGVMRKNAVLIIGIHEKLPRDYPGVITYSERLGIYIKNTI